MPGGDWLNAAMSLPQIQSFFNYMKISAMLEYIYYVLVAAPFVKELRNFSVLTTQELCQINTGFQDTSLLIIQIRILIAYSDFKE